MASDKQLLNDLCQKTYKEQAIWWLNAFWDTPAGSASAEKLWEYVSKLNELDLDHHENGCGVDELRAHVFLEKFDETLTVREMREKLRKTGAIGEAERPKLVPLTHYLLFRFDEDWHRLVTAPQGSKEEVEKAQRMLDAAQAALADAQAKHKAAREAEQNARARENEAVAAEKKAKEEEASAIAAANEAKEREAEAVSSAEVARQREAENVAAQKELEQALAELKAEENAYNAKTEQLKQKSEGGGVAALRAKNELAQHLGEDPLPLRRAKINQEAAVRKADKATQAAVSARAAAEDAANRAQQARAAAEDAANQATNSRVAAEEARRQATTARQAAEDAAAAAEQSLQEAQQRFAEAEAYFEEAKNKIGEGQIWWLERELHEAKAYLPQAKGGYKKGA